MARPVCELQILFAAWHSSKQLSTGELQTMY